MSLHVLHIVEAIIAGTRRNVYSLATELDRKRFEVHVACPLRRQGDFGESGFVEDLRRAGVMVFPVPLQRQIRPFPDAVALRALVTLIRHQHYDIVHTHSSKAGFLGRLAARIAGVPAIIHTPHGLHFLGQRNPFKRQVFLRLEQVASRWGNHIVATSPSEQEALLRWKIAPAAQIVQIGNGIDSDALPANTDAAALRAAQGIPNDGPLIGTMARITAQKNPQLFLHAAAQVAAQIPAARFVWIGDGDMAEQARGLAGSLGIAERVTFLGYREQGAALLPMLDQFWLTSRFEGLPYALLEAMALGLPVVATDVVGNRDLVAAGRTGLLTPPDNPDALAQAAAYLIQHPVEAAALGRRGRTEVLAHHTARQMVERVTQLYLAALPPAGHAPILA